MSQNQEIERLAQKIDRLAVNAGRTLAESFAANFTGGFKEMALRQRLVVEHVFIHAATEALKNFPTLKDTDKPPLRKRAIAAVKAAFKQRLAELDRAKS